MLCYRPAGTTQRYLEDSLCVASNARQSLNEILSKIGVSALRVLLSHFL